MAGQNGNRRGSSSRRAERKRAEEDSLTHFTAKVHREGAWYIAQAVEVDVASQGGSEGEAVANLREALELYFMSNRPLSPDGIPEIEVAVAAT